MKSRVSISIQIVYVVFNQQQMKYETNSKKKKTAPIRSINF